MDIRELQFVLPGTTGGPGGKAISEFPSEIENFLIAGGTPQDGDVYSLPSGRVSFTGVMDADDTEVFAGIAEGFFSNDPDNFPDAYGIQMTFDGTGGIPDVVGNGMDRPWGFMQWRIRDFSGVGASCKIKIGG